MKVQCGVRRVKAELDAEEVTTIIVYLCTWKNKNQYSQFFISVFLFPLNRPIVEITKLMLMLEKKYHQ